MAQVLERVQSVAAQSAEFVRSGNPTMQQTQAVDYDYRALALAEAGVSNLTELGAYCGRHQIPQYDWCEIYCCIFDFKAFGKFECRRSGGDLIADTIRDEADRDEKLCDILQLKIVDLELEYGDIVIPAGMPSVEIYRFGTKLAIATVHPKTGAYHVPSQSVGYDNPYGLAIALVDPTQVEAARVVYEEGLVEREAMPEYF